MTRRRFFYTSLLHRFVCFDFKRNMHTHTEKRQITIDHNVLERFLLPLVIYLFITKNVILVFFRPNIYTYTGQQLHKYVTFVLVHVSAFGINSIHRSLHKLVSFFLYFFSHFTVRIFFFFFPNSFHFPSILSLLLRLDGISLLSVICVVSFSFWLSFCFDATHNLNLYVRCDAHSWTFFFPFCLCLEFLKRHPIQIQPWQKKSRRK